MKPTILRLLVTVILLAGLFSAPGYGFYEVDGKTLKWPTPLLVLHAASDQFTSGSDYRDALEAAIKTWNDSPTWFRFDVEYDTDSSAMTSSNDVSEVWFTTDPDLLEGRPARRIKYYNKSGEFTEADIVFDAAFSWSTSTDKIQLLHYGGENRFFQTDAVHELGHALGLMHVNYEYNVMGSDETHLHANGDTVNFYPGEDATDGAVALYGLDFTLKFESELNPLDNKVSISHSEDLGAVHRKYAGADGEYSSHTRTGVYGVASATPAGLVPDLSPRLSTILNDEPYYYVSPGETVFLEVTLENNGSTTQHPLVKFYYSSNDLITTDDEELASRTPGLSRNDVYTILQQVKIPSSAPSGYAYLGVIVDADDALKNEISEENNATYIGIYVYDSLY